MIHPPPPPDDRVDVQVPGLPTLDALGRIVRTWITSRETRQAIADQAIRHEQRKPRDA